MEPENIGVVVEKIYEDGKGKDREKNVNSKENDEKNGLYFVDPNEHREFVASMLSLVEDLTKAYLLRRSQKMTIKNLHLRTKSELAEMADRRINEAIVILDQLIKEMSDGYETENGITLIENLGDGIVRLDRAYLRISPYLKEIK